MSSWTLLTNHGWALLCIINDPQVRLRDIAADLGITERRTYDIVVDLAEGGYVIKRKEGRRNRYEVPPGPMVLPADGPPSRLSRGVGR